MSVESVKKYFAENDYNYDVLEFEASTATVELAAQALGVQPALIAKTMSFRLKEGYALVLAAGDRRVDNRKYKDVFNQKAKMLDLEEVQEITGHPVGGVCPFALKNDIFIYLDSSLKEYEFVYPAAGSPNSAVKITPEELQAVTGGDWVDICK
ncbi:MAG: YbaK/EbsC family protein [Eubacteriales bacterium]